jgi:hypothetical protein
MSQMDRRSFFRHAGALSLGAIAWACTKGSSKSSPTPASGSAALSVAPTAQYLAKGDTRQAFALIQGERPIAPRDVTATIRASDGKAAIPVDLSRQQVRLGQGGSATGTEVLEIYAFRHEFTPGIWLIEVKTGSKTAEAAFQVTPDAPEPKIGDQAPRSESPTMADHRGVEPICTRKPICSMHEMTIAEAIASGKPTVVTFASPKFCQSRTCGPTVDVVESVAKSFRESVNFVHVEVFKDEKTALTEEGDSPTFAEWKLGTDPIMYFIDASGTIKDHWTGSAGVDELQGAVSALTKA